MAVDEDADTEFVYFEEVWPLSPPPPPACMLIRNNHTYRSDQIHLCHH